jgi:hypothetical protein
MTKAQVWDNENNENQKWLYSTIVLFI